MTLETASMTEPPLSKLYAECESALRLYRLMQKTYSNLVEDCPPALLDHINALNGYLFSELQQTLEEALTHEDARALCALVEALKADRGGKLW
jgi:hypothetical protein